MSARRSLLRGLNRLLTESMPTCSLISPVLPKAVTSAPRALLASYLTRGAL
jgi:hypothetical protein